MKLKILLGVMITLVFSASMGVEAAGMVMKGKGSVNGIIQFFSQDILYLEKEIYNLVSECGKELN